MYHLWYGHTFLFLLDLYLGVEFQDHMMALFNLLGSHKNVFQASAPPYIPTSRAQVSNFSTASSPPVIAHLFYHSHPGGH